jgi:hypothetical protein
MSLFDSTRVTGVFTISIPTDTVVQAVARVIPPKDNKTAVVLSLNADGGAAADTVDFYPASEKGQTTVTTAAAASGTTVVLQGDTGANDTLNGHAVSADNDWVMLNLDSRDFILGDWQISKIDTLGGATSGSIDITDAFNVVASADQFNNATTFRAASSIGRPAYIIDAADKASITVGSGTVNLENVFAGKPGHPCIITANGTTTGAKMLTAVVGYIDTN